MKCKNFVCPLLGGHPCCAECILGEICEQACLNAPDRCGLAREETPSELLAHYHVERILPLDLADLIATGEPEGRFYEDLGKNEELRYNGIDNQSGEPVQKRFATIAEMCQWFAGRGAKPGSGSATQKGEVEE